MFNGQPQELQRTEFPPNAPSPPTSYMGQTKKSRLDTVSKVSTSYSLSSSA